MPRKNRLTSGLIKSTRTFINILPIIIGMLLATSLVITLFPDEIATALFPHGDLANALSGAALGSLAAGLAAAFLYSRALKLPLLPLMIYYFGAGYTSVLCLYLLAFAVINDILVEKLAPVRA